jgi:diguanylate cyclase (GGDEF)-like protein
VAGLTGFYQRTWEQNRDAIEQHLFTDMLTGLPNRRRMLNDLATVSDPVLYLINPDYFNQINDVFGARVGDRVLVELARTLEELIPSDAHSLYKLHADEFALVLVQNQRGLSDDDITTVAERLSRGLGEHSFLGSEYMLRVGVSIGIANTRVVGREKLLPRADIALKTAKAQHKPWMLFKEAAAVETRFRENITRLAALTTAIQEKRIAAYYQPIFESSSGALHKYECLARMVQQDGSVVGPGHFLDLSKKARLYQHITGAVLEAAFDTFRDVSREFSINLSVLDILNRDTNALIKETIAREPEVAARLVIELLESEQIEELAEVRDFASEMRKSGVRIAIDDFGSGYSNFAYTASLKLDYLKIDGSLIRNVCTSQEAVDIVGTIVEFARKLGSRTIAEFVSDGPTFDRVKELGVDYCQGFFLGKPVERVERDAPS